MLQKTIHSASNLDSIVPQTRTKFGDRAFAVASLEQSSIVPQIDEDYSQF